ncbi:MAG TPA: sn-glycerol-3-phosphate ABC transporter substrate-binding protein UgpB [Methylomirabilota bacterium]|jgi:sn-glycerol 3-phosphate transport system substrate-binding protein|nr:sn-glycerol-3-phosphate ABC transporter substrate-binding protein UgpB [Methylomirabilota bacterium]
MRVPPVLVGALAALLLAISPPGAQAATEIQWWHAMDGALGEWVDELATGFNKSQTEYRVNAVYKGNYTEVMTGAIAAFRAKQQPHIVQVFEVGTATMMAAKGAIKPVYQLMAEAGEKFDPKAYLPAVTGYYTTADGKMLSLPLNSSTPVLYYNKDAFKKAGLDTAKPPRTWSEMGEYAKKIQAGGYPCGFSTQWQQWILLENYSAWHNVPFASKQNGFAGLDTELLFNGPLHLRLVQQLAEWQKTKLFDYGGRRGDANPKFATGECGMFLASSAAYAGFVKATQGKFEFGIGMLPYWPDVAGAPQNSIIGGATLWVLSGHKPVEYQGVAKFFTYVSSPEVQAASHQRTGYLPITLAAYELTKKQGYYEKNPGTDIPIRQLNNKPPTDNSKGLRLGNFVQIRDAIDDELEGVWAGKKTAKEGLDGAVKRGNELLRQFERANR